VTARPSKYASVTCCVVQPPDERRSEIEPRVRNGPIVEPAGGKLTQQENSVTKLLIANFRIRRRRRKLVSVSGHSRNSLEPRVSTICSDRIEFVTAHVSANSTLTSEDTGSTQCVSSAFLTISAVILCPVSGTTEPQLRTVQTQEVGLAVSIAELAD